MLESPRDGALIVTLAILLALAPGPADVELPAESIALPPGSRLHEEADVASRSIAVLDEEADLVPLETRDGWVRVRSLEATGWVRKGPTYSLAAERGGWTASSENDDEALLARARTRFAGPVRDIGLGPLRLLTDASDPAMTKELESAVTRARFGIAYRFGFGLPEGSGPVLALHARPGNAPSDGERICGRAGRSVAFATVEGGTPEEKIDQILHQAGHLFAAEAFGDEIPPWLEEGMANAFVEAARSAEPTPTDPRVPRSTESSPHGIPHFSSPWADSNSRRVELPPVARLQSAELPCAAGGADLGEVLGSGPELFHADSDAACARRTAADLVRFLSDAWISKRPWRLRMLIRDVAEGRAVLDPPTLLTYLDEDLASLERKLQAASQRR